MDYRHHLNKQQYKVVTEGEGRSLVLAGAGSGKTRTITYRIAYLLQQGVKPHEILLVTFTNKAADEMVSRVKEITDLNKDNLKWAGTFHSICYKILKLHADKLDYDDNFTILDSDDSEKLLKKCIEEIGISTTNEKFPKAGVLQSIISFAKNSETPIESVLEMQHSKYFEHLETIEHIASEYEKKKKNSNTMDFDDLLLNLIRLLQNNPEIKNRYSSQFKYVLADEYQDTNTLQATILKLFSEHHENLLVVGDDAQSIYSFRAADISNILEFEKDFDEVNTFKLETNYRSTPEILELANEAVGNNENQREKKLRSIKEGSHPPKLKEFSDQKREANFIAKKIEELRDQGVSLEEISVLFRASHHSQSLEVELSQRGIPYEFRGGLRFFQRAHIKDILAYLKVLLNPEDISAWNRVLTQYSGIGTKTSAKIIDKIQLLENLDEIHSIESSLNSRAKEGWNNFMSVWKDIREVEESTPANLIKAIKNSYYKIYLENEYENHEDRLKDIEQLLFSAFNLVDRDRESYEQLREFLAETSMQQGHTEDSGRKKVVLSTVHQAKGLEWEAVFIMNLTEKQFPNERALQPPSGLEEERRLFYVALTRAKKHLYLTYPITSVFSQNSFQRPSRFIKEVEHLLKDDNQEAISREDELTYELEESTPGFLSDLDEL